MTISFEEEQKALKDMFLGDSNLNKKKFNNLNGLSTEHLKKKDRDEIVEREDNKNGVEVKNESLQLFKEKNFEAAKNRFKAALQFLMVGSKNYSQVKELYRDDVLECLQHIVQISLMNNEWKDALDYCTHIIDMDKNNVKAFILRSTAWKHLEDIYEAISDLEEALRLDPSNKKVKESLKQLKKDNNIIDE